MTRWKVFVVLVSVFAGVHTVLWLLLLWAHTTGGLSDQSPVFLLVVIANLLDSPARWVLGAMGVNGNMVALFLAGTLQWVIIAGGLTQVIGIFVKHAHCTATTPTSP